MDLICDRFVRAWDEALEGMSGTFSLDLRSASGRVASRDADALHYPASTIKLAVLMAFLRDRSARLGSAICSVTINSRFPSAAGGVFELLQSDDQDDETWSRLGTGADLLQLADRMITVSSNIATDLLLEQIGFASVQRYLSELNLAPDFQVNRLIGDSKAEENGISNSVTASALGTLMASICSRTDSDSNTALGILARQTHLNMIPAGLPEGTWSASKGGWVTGVKHDVALVRPTAAPPFVLSVCTTSDLPDAEGFELVARLSAVTWEQWNRWHAS